MLTSLLETYQGATRGASFAYDDEGRLISVERSSDGATWLNQSWAYEGDALVSRTNTFTTNYWYQSADEAMVSMPDGYSSNWDQSLTRVDGDCALPPISLVHGYPDEETVYRLGWSRGEVPNQVGFAYGYNGFGWNYGDLSWFGHGGIATYYGPDYWTEGTEVTIEMNYVDGVMVEEVVTFQH